jgi:hypothetical protein
MTETTRAKKAILNAFVRGKLIVTAADLERVRVEHNLSKDAFNRARSELRALGWIERTRESNDPHAPVLWIAHPECMFGRNTSHLRRKDGGMRAKSFTGWRREIARTVARADSDTQTLGEEHGARLTKGTVSEAQPRHVEHWCKEFWGGGGAFCRCCQAPPEVHQRRASERPIEGIRLIDVGVPYQPRLDD